MSDIRRNIPGSTPPNSSQNISSKKSTTLINKSSTATPDAKTSTPRAKKTTKKPNIVVEAPLSALTSISFEQQSVPTIFSPEDRQRMIAEAAYYRAEQRGFDGGDQIQDWIEAETEIDAMLKREQSTSRQI